MTYLKALEKLGIHELKTAKKYVEKKKTEWEKAKKLIRKTDSIFSRPCLKLRTSSCRIQLTCLLAVHQFVKNRFQHCPEQIFLDENIPIEK